MKNLNIIYGHIEDGNTDVDFFKIRVNFSFL